MYSSITHAVLKRPLCQMLSYAPIWRIWADSYRHTVCINKNPICIKAFTSNCEYITGLVSLAFAGRSHEHAICVKSYCARTDILCVIRTYVSYTLWTTQSQVNTLCAAGSSHCVSWKSAQLIQWVISLRKSTLKISSVDTGSNIAAQKHRFLKNFR